ncbi:C4-type zinc ribbon domain-containing protein [Pseudenhygromyxa sp. WMMC2535]|uniref:zinc ribbon domain-containing protein n=1 Tax=Pseudenhygromyxa sp. WMMC2535 TaxID=2712867 RepID=UPI001555F38D|nr:C4-type zinc ribbon domain-containing protein [Pseudenhygromyxa sp. WMMC2535]
MSSIERKLAAIPRRKREMDRDLEKLEAMLHNEVEKLDESHAFRHDQERLLDDEREQIRSSKQRISQVKTPRELAAAQRELDATQRMSKTRQDELVRIDEAVAEAEGRIKAMQAGLDDLRQTFDAERTRLDEIDAKLQRSAKKARKSRKHLLDSVEKGLLRRYERIRRRGGVGFVPVNERRCSACKMAVAHQTYVSLRAGEIIPVCESCGRLLYWSGLFPDEGKAKEPKPKSAPDDKPKAEPAGD